MLKHIRRKCAQRAWQYKNIMVVSYPKSGRTWLRVMLNDLNYFPIFEHYDSKYFENKTAETICSDLSKLYRYRIVLLTRDPRDTVVSNYFQAHKVEKIYHGPLADFIKDPHLGIEKICAFNQRLYENRHNFERFYHLKYEDLVADTASALEDMITVMMLKRKSCENISTVVANNRFEKLQEKERSGELARRYPNRFRKGGEGDPEKLKVRKGKAGGYAEYLSEEDIRYCRKIMSDYGYDISVLNSWV